jgi:hypothetical protein
MQRLLLVVVLLLLSGSPGHAENLSYSLTASEPVTVNTAGGVPRLALSLGGQTRYATYSPASSTATVLVFDYSIQPGDFAPAGVEVTGAVDLNGAIISDLAGNPLVPAFTLAANPLVKVQTYTVAFNGAISNSTATNAGITVSRAPAGASFTYTISSSGGSGSVTGSSTISSASPQSVTGLDVSGLPAGTLTASVTVTTSAGTGEARTATIVPSFTGVLDGLPAAAAAYSIRRLRTAYSGPLLRVRRSSDNAEQDLSGTTVGGSISTMELSSFCGSSSCFVRTWYDQSGSARNGLQSGASNQPIIANSGALVTTNGKLSLSFGGRVLQTAAAAAWLNGTAYSINAVGAANSTQGYFVGTNASSTNVGLHIGWRSTNTFTVAHYGIDGDFSASISSAATVYTVSKANPGGSAAFLNGASIGTSALPNVNLATAAILNIGWGYRVTDPWAGTMAELTLFTTVLSTGQRQTLERNQGSHYNITVQ